jgi:hypothetical protein
VVLLGVLGELGIFSGGHGAVGQAGQRVGVVVEGGFEVGRVDVEFVGGEGADLTLLVFEGGKGPRERSSSWPR